MLLEKFEVVGIVCMTREELEPEPDSAWALHDQKLFRKHFEDRFRIEKEEYGDLNHQIYSDRAPTIFVDHKSINSEKTLEFVKEVKADACFIFGTGLIKFPIIGALPFYKLNLHLGLSPWYRGSATLFWPFYFLQPQFAGATLHQIVPEADAGDIVHQILPCLVAGQGIHKVATEVVKKSAYEIVSVFEILKKSGQLPLFPQKSSGKLYLAKDFEPHHLRIIYDLYDNKIVDAWIGGELGNRKPRVINIFNSNA